MPLHEQRLHAGPAQVQVAVLQPEVLGHRFRLPGGPPGHHRLLGDGEGQPLGPCQDDQVRGQDLDLPGGQGRVLGLRLALHDLAPQGHAELVAQAAGPYADLGRGAVRPEDHLYDAATVAQVHENHLAVVAQRIHPAGQLHLPADVRRAQSAAFRARCETHHGFTHGE